MAGCCRDVPARFFERPQDEVALELLARVVEGQRRCRRRRRHGYRVVTQERKAAIRKMSLASAAGYLGLPAVDVRTMLKFEGILDFGPV